MELRRETRTGANISSEIEILTYTNQGPLPIQVVARIDLGSAGGFLSGTGGLYLASVIASSREVVPVGEVVVASGKTSCSVVSKSIPVSAGEVISLRVKGQTTDTSVNVIATLQDATPLRQADIYGGGSVLVDHDYGGTDALSYRFSSGTGIVGAEVLAYVRADYEAGQRSYTSVVARTVTVASGRWSRPLLLNPGEYKLVLYKPGQAGPDLHNLTVA